MIKKIIFVLAILFCFSPVITEAKANITNSTFYTNAHRIDVADLETIKSIVSNNVSYSSAYNWILFNYPDLDYYNVLIYEGYNLPPMSIYTATSMYRDTRVDNGFAFFFLKNKLLQIDKKDYTVTTVNHTGEFINMRFTGVMTPDGKWVEFDGTDSFYQKIGIDFNSSYNLDGYEFFFPIAYASGSISLNTTTYSNIDYYRNNFFGDYGDKLYFGSIVDDSILNRSDNQVVLNYNGSNNSVVDLIFESSDSSYNDSCKTFFKICVSPGYYETDYLDIFLNSDDNFSLKIYYSTDKENWILGSEWPSGEITKSLFKHYNTISRFTNTNFKFLKYSIGLKEEQNLFVNAKYSNQYVNLEYTQIVYDDSYYEEFDMTGIYAIGLIPKDYSSYSFSTIKFLGNYTFYGGYSKGLKVFDYKKVSSSVLTPYNFDIVGKESFLETDGKLILYMINDEYKNTEYDSKILYLSEKFDLVVFENELSYVVLDDYSYSAPSKNVSFEDNFGNSVNDSLTYYDFSNPLSYVPTLLKSLTATFSLFGSVITTIFVFFPPEVTATLLLTSLLVVIIVMKKTIF